MDSIQEKKPHALCIPAPPQGHINPMLKLAKILHSKGFLITFVNTEFNHQRLLKSRGSDALNGLPSFGFESIPDGLPLSQNFDTHQNHYELYKSTQVNCLGPFKSLIAKLSDKFSPVTCIISDFMMGFTLDAAKELDIPAFIFWTAGPGSLICYDQYPALVDKGFIPLKDPADLDTILDCIPNMDGIRLKNIPDFIRHGLPHEEFFLKFRNAQIEKAKTAASGMIFNTFDDLEHEILETLASAFPPCYGIGPLHLLESNVIAADHESLASISSNFWKEDDECLKWLDSKPPCSVLYINFGSIVSSNPQLQLVEFCWGLANSNHSFLWIVSSGPASRLPSDFLEATSGRGMLAGWCPQEQVMNHPSIGGFLTHSGWNSTLESISSGVPMLCCPFFSDQLPNSWLSCNKWGIAMEIDHHIKRDEVTKVVIELMDKGQGSKIRKNAVNWKNKANEACTFPFGSSVMNLEKLIHQLQKKPSMARL